MTKNQENDAPHGVGQQISTNRGQTPPLRSPRIFPVVPSSSIELLLKNRYHEQLKLMHVESLALWEIKILQRRRLRGHMAPMQTPHIPSRAVL